MNAWLSFSALAALLATVPLATVAGAQDATPPLGHMVLFELRDDGDAAVEELISACEKHLSGHDGTLHFSVGARAKELSRDVNDSGFDVALHVVFANKAAHDGYQTHPRHLAFIEQNEDNWKKVTVFDSYLRTVED